MHRVFVSSTFVDLRRHRRAVLDVIRQLGAIDIAMEHFGAVDARPKDECLRLIREETDVFVGIYAHRYGSIPDGDETSITQQEYEEARKANRPRFLYQVDPSYRRWPAAQIDTGTSADKLKAFKVSLGNERWKGRFTTRDRLAAAVAADLGRYFSTQLDEQPLEVHGVFLSPPADWVSQARRSQQRFKVVACDLDGTLIRGADFDFSWEAIWNSLGFGRKIQIELKRAYRQRSNESASREGRIEAYRDWCDQAVALFKSRGLTRAQLRDLATGLSLTQNCRPALARLREAGMTIAIVSGGVNTFLEDLFADYRDFVDFVFINELTFLRDGALQGVLATAYDFEGKVDALDLICARVGCLPSEAVFVGDQYNDEGVMLHAGLAIAYPSQAIEAGGTAQVAVDKDDLLAIVPHVLEE